MPFAYYRRLNPVQKRIYDRSVSISSIFLPGPERFSALIGFLQEALKRELREKTEEGAQALVSALLKVLSAGEARVKVLERRPSRNWGELHGLYEFTPGKIPLITVWMRTAKRVEVVAFKTFLRTLLHEVNHHLDYHLLKLPDSFHTEGFYQRESSLLKQLLSSPASH